MGKFLRYLFTFIGFAVVLSLLISIGSLTQLLSPGASKLTEPALLHLELEGIILDGKDFLSRLREYREEDKIKGVIVQVNSPGGVVGPSQEIYAEIKKVRDELKKPVIISCSGLAASGAYYAAVAGSKIITNPGTLMGSIGVIMEFANLEKLYDWAHIHRYAITSGPMKDAGSDHRPMTPEEKKVFQGLIMDVYEQFKSAVRDNRKVEPAVLDQNTDGRIFTGAMAVKMGFADEIGTFDDAIRIAGEMSGLGKRPKLFKPPRKRENLIDLLTEEARGTFSKFMGAATHINLVGQPLFLMPGTLGL